MGFYEDMKKDMKKQRKRMTLNLNKTKGKMKEVVYESMRSMQGYNVKRKAHGSDYEEQKIDLITRKPKSRKILLEIKSSRTAPMSKLQKKTKKKHKGSYRVERF